MLAGQSKPLLLWLWWITDFTLLSTQTNMVKKYNKAKNDWDVMGRLPVRADMSNGWGLAFKACGGELLVVGGQRGPDSEGILSSWSPKSGADNGMLNWKVLGMKENGGVFV
ncbi:hypothetical protein MLD38_017300 [Melastoma candidum]|uniref:Uncharacterized protein n=1 Tax=Melastoma candidum TaxID=119954 RepID=A0ACB9QS43_9MYRT|nr:hypothetical protein MLD38_017300 [Melastoma candidum]